MPTLCIGGPMDGKLVDIDTMYLTVPIPTEPNTQIDSLDSPDATMFKMGTYEKQGLYDKCGVYYVLVFQGVNPVKALIDGYSKS